MKRAKLNRYHAALWLIGLAAGLSACDSDPSADAGIIRDAGDAIGDAGPLDASADAGPAGDASAGDADVALDGSLGTDGGAIDGGLRLDGAVVNDGGADSDGGAGHLDAGSDAGFDAGFDAGSDAGFDAGFDAGSDAGFDAGPPAGGCISGATGTHVVRFTWDGSSPGSTAYVRYDANTLPDTARWRVTANSRSIGYRPVFTDTFLGEGGLDLHGTGFIDVELSTAGLTGVRNVTLAIYGRSFNTTSAGSFSWQTFSGTGAAPYNSVHNSAPYEWYGADATAALPAGDDGVLLRIKPGPGSNALIVRRVEICFDAG